MTSGRHLVTLLIHFHSSPRRPFNIKTVEIGSVDTPDNCHYLAYSAPLTPSIVLDPTLPAN